LSHTRVSCRTNGLSARHRKYSREIKLWVMFCPGNVCSSMFAKAEMNWWPFMYRPTVPELLASPFGKRELADRSRRCELQQYPDATTNTFARYSIGASGRS